MNHGKSYKGWTGYPLSKQQSENNILRQLNLLNKKQRQYEYIITSPNGTVYTVQNLGQFIEEYKLYSDDYNIKCLIRYFQRIAKDNDNNILSKTGWKCIRDYSKHQDQINCLENQLKQCQNDKNLLTNMLG